MALTPQPGPVSGSGPQTISLAAPTDQPSVVEFSCPACVGPVKVTGNSYPPLMIDKAGPYQGQVFVDTTVVEGALVLTVTADADWTAAVVPLFEFAPSPMANSGEGDAVLLITDPATGIALSYPGEGDFTVVLYKGDGSSFTINETGPYEDTVEFNSPGIVEIVADGPWTVTAQ